MTSASNSHHHHLLLLSLLLLLLLLLNPASSNIFNIGDVVQEAISMACRNTRDPRLCQHSVRHQLPKLGDMPRPVNLNFVLEMHISETKRITKRVLVVATRMSNNATLNEVVRMALKNCLSDDYPTVIDSLDAAVEKLKAGDWPGLNIELSAVLSGFGYCDDQFVEIPYSPLAGYNEKLSNITKIMLDLSSFIK